MLCQDLVRGYGRRNAQASCLFKIDLQKAYDALDWNFLQEMMTALKFPNKFVQLIMKCVTTARFSLMINGVPTRLISARRGVRQGDPMSPLLFVIGMEYLSRILAKVAKHPDFKYHHRCSNLQLTHMCFADDLLMFSKGDFKAAYLLLRGFQLFSMTSGLKANKMKSAIYGVGLNEESWYQLTEASGFQRSKLPFKYLGMSISNKRITKTECECLVEKMVKRIRIWSTRNLSYAGKCVLINSVLMSINTYWSQMIILPCSVIDRINQICRGFLWKNGDNMEGPGRISWAEICKPKQHGGLGFKDIGLWNKCALGKYVWALANKEDNMWVKWIHAVYIKQQDWWDYVAPSSSSWYWKQLVRVKDGLKVIYHQKLSAWDQYSVAKAYILMKNNAETRWNYAAIWDRLGHPKHKFIAWLVLKQRLPTRDRLHRFGVTQETMCVICGLCPESHRHLFFECKFSTRCLEPILNWLGIDSFRFELPGLLNWIRRSKHSSCRRRAYTSAICACIYHIWVARNSALWNLQLPLIGYIIQHIRLQICHRFSWLLAKNLSIEDLSWWLLSLTASWRRAGALVSREKDFDSRLAQAKQALEADNNKLLEENKKLSKLNEKLCEDQATLTLELQEAHDTLKKANEEQKKWRESTVLVTQECKQLNLNLTGSKEEIKRLEERVEIARTFEKLTKMLPSYNVSGVQGHP
ncbi:uncharacterized protein LOC133799466 [Humulus lupulus]|uniref:uncharacterized protein LOC133799466 n=1 Tax=Humulus lupulus TaxID=3486 RepID=UPI002B406600|nr:uncharacterized protein LOC133799466 [Humulus lupulus]